MAGQALLIIAAVAIPYLYIYRPWDGRWRVPLSYSQDVNFHAMLVKNMILEGGYKTTDSLGAPFGQQLYDFPLGGDHLHLLALKLLTGFSRDPYIVLNLYYGLSFLLVALAAYIVFRKLGLRPLWSAAPAILFAFLPYHFWHQTSRVFLSAYYSVPLGVLLAVWVVTDGVPLRRNRGQSGSSVTGSNRIRWLAILSCAFVVGSGSAYYAAFSVCIIGFMAAVEAIRRMTIRPVAAAGAVVGAICLVLVANLIPDIRWRWEHGSNPQVANRSVAEMERHGLRLAQILLPSERERLSQVVTIGPAARATEPTEDDAYIGIFGVAGLALAIGLTLAGGLGPQKLRLPRQGRCLTLLPLIAILLGGVGALNVVIGTLGLTAIRSWSRIGTFVSFAALGTLAFVLQRATTSVNGRTKVVVIVVVVGAVCAGLFDEVPKTSVVPAYSEIAAAQRSDTSFVTGMEAALPAGSMVFQLPVLPFPEGPHVEDIIDYDLLKGYLSGSGKLRWSYGGMRGRESDWQISWSQQPVTRMVQGVAASGFSALYVDRAGYADRGALLDAAVRPMTGPPMATSDDRRLRWYDLRPVRAEMERRLPPGELRALGRAVTGSPLTEFLGGDFGPEVDQFGQEFRWLARSATMAVKRVTERATRVDLSLVAHGPEGHTLSVRRAGVSKTVPLSPEGVRVELPLVLDEATVNVRFVTDAPRADASGEKRDLRVRLTELTVLAPVVARALPSMV